VLTHKQMIYAAPERFSLGKLGELLSDRLGVKVEKVDGFDRSYLDTFDWRLYRSGMALEVEHQGAIRLLVWRELNSGKVLFSRTVRRLPQNADDFSDAGGQSKLKQVLGRRSLIAQATLNGDTEKLILVNKDEKTVMRVELRRDQILSPQSGSHIAMEDVIYLFPYRGYETEFRDRLRWMERDGGLSPISRDPLLSALDALGVTPGQYTSRPVFSLSNDTPALEALVQILKSFLQIIDSNVAGARIGKDPEFLHDLLVAVRRTSDLLNGFAPLFPAKNLELMQHGFRWVEKEATPIRDLDIYMSLFHDFESRVDAEHRSSLDSLYDFLNKQKKKELRGMRTSLDSPRYYKLIESWSDFLHGCQESDRLPKAAKEPIGSLAREHIREIYRELVKRAKGVSNDSSIDEICKLFHLSKHLGHHMDMFSSLFPRKKMGRLLKSHERLQSSLNQFRDMTLQHSRLKEYKSKMKKTQAVRDISLEAVEQLIADREREKVKAHKRVMKQIKRFTRKKMRKRINSILAAPVKSSHA